MNLTDLMKPWIELPIAVIDFETTGLEPEGNGVVEIGVVRFEGGEVVDKHGAFVDPGMPIPTEATAIHGITDEMVKGAPNLKDAISSRVITEILEGAVPAAYNAAFDRKWWPSFSWIDPVGEWPAWIDPLVMVRHLDKFAAGKGRHKLEAACKRRGISIESAHRAVDDAEAAGKLLFVLAEEMPSIWEMTVLELLRRQAIHAERQEADFQKWLAKQPARETK